MSYQTSDGLPVESPRTVQEQNRFLTEIYQEWCDRDRARLRGLAALTLHADGWTLEMVRTVLGFGDRSAARKAIERTRVQLRVHFQDRLPGLDQRDQGFVRPD